MKNKINWIFAPLSIGALAILFVFGCNNNSTKSEVEQKKTELPYSGTSDDSEVNDSGLAKNLTGQNLFQNNCGACHKINEKIIGPKLGDVDKRRSKEWLHKFIRNPQKMIEDGDVFAKQLADSFGGNKMPPYEFLSEPEIDSILAHIKYQSAVK
jgi:cytochrome c551/c552